MNTMQEKMLYRQRLEAMSGTELRLELAGIEAEPAKSWNGIYRKRNQLNLVTAELLRRGSF